MAPFLFTHRKIPNKGSNLSPFSASNLALHVGDDPERVLANRQELTNLVGPSVYMNQVHGNRVVVVDSIPQVQPTADALVTQERSIALVCLVADCIPLLLWDADEIAVAAVHVGRAGLINSITANVLSVMQTMGAKNIYAHIGPSICGTCYEVGADIYDQVVSEFPLAASKTSAGTLALDLAKALEGQLLSEGVAVSRSDVCTLEDQGYFSYRRDAITGRQAGVIWLS